MASTTSTTFPPGRQPTMSEGVAATPTPSDPTPIVRASIFVATIAATLITIGVLLFFDLFLARVDERESRAHAASEYAAGSELLRAGRASEAADRFGAAVAIERTNVNYALALGEAMLDEGRPADAEATLKALLERTENDGAVNLTMARVMEREGRIEEAKAYYHRAVFGRWGADSIARRTEARFGLIDLLARRGAARELLAELLPIEGTSPDSVALRRRLGQLFLLAGSPARAANMFREVLRREPEDADAYAGLGEAALAGGNLRTARADFTEASRLRPDDAAIQGRLVIVDSALALDPTARGLGSHDRYERSRILLARTLAALASCGPAEGSLADSARAKLSRTVRASGEDAASDAVTAAAVDLWASRPASCGAVPDEPLRLVHARLAQ